MNSQPWLSFTTHKLTRDGDGFPRTAGFTSPEFFTAHREYKFRVVPRAECRVSSRTENHRISIKIHPLRRFVRQKSQFSPKAPRDLMDGPGYNDYSTYTKVVFPNAQNCKRSYRIFCNKLIYSNYKRNVILCWRLSGKRIKIVEFYKKLFYKRRPPIWIESVHHFSLRSRHRSYRKIFSHIYSSA